ncbi:MAG: hypothetical protein H0T94_13055 [Acidimicrobiia bacterium]|nr:hypothetical protein [Acidimicrobiia bacterium]
MTFSLVLQVDEAHNKVGDVAMIPYSALKMDCCRSSDLKSRLSAEELSIEAMSDNHAYLPAEHWSAHEFEGLSDSEVAEVGSRPGVSAAAVYPGQEPPAYTEHDLDRSAFLQRLAIVELVRRGHDPKKVAELSEGRWWPPDS